MNIASLLARIGFQVDKRPLEGVEKSLEGIKAGLEVLGAAELAHKLFEMAEHWGHFAEELGISATAAGITVEALQRLQYSAGLAGVGAEEVSHGMGKLTRALSEARGGSQEAVQAFAALGINQQQLMSFKTSRDALMAVSDGMHGVSDSIARQNLAFKLFGRGAVNMVEWLSMGREAMKHEGDEADRLSAVISGETIESLRQMEDAMTSMFTTFRASAATIMGYLAPAIKLLANALQETWARYQGLFKVRLEAWALRASYIFGYMVGAVEALVAKFVRFAQAHPQLIEAAAKYGLVLFGLATAFGTLGLLSKVASIAFGLVGSGLSALGLPMRAVFGGLGLISKSFGYLLLGLGRLVGFFFPAIAAWIGRMGALLIATPFGQVLAAITGIAAAVLAVGAAAYTAWEMFKGKSFAETWLGQLWAKKGKLLDTMKGFLGFGPEGEDASAKATMGLEPVLDSAKALSDGPMVLDSMRNSPLSNEYMRQAAVTPEANKIFNFQNDITINAGAGTDPTSLQRAVNQMFKQLMDQSQRQTNRSLDTQKAY